MRRLGVITVFLAAAFVLAGSTSAGEGPGPTGRYIVVLASGDPADVAAAHARNYGARPFAVYSSALRGYAAHVPEGRVAALRNDPRVAYVEPDQTARAFAQTVPTGVGRIFADGNASLDIDSTDDARVDVDVAVIDTGIDLDHPDLDVVASTNCAGGGPFKSSCGSGGDDGNGHGTHVAGTIGAIDNGVGVVGVAPGARLWAVRVLADNGSGYISWIVAGIDWVTARADQIEVANMSLGCECSSDALDTAIANSVDRGVAYAVAAGNSDANAASFSPANHPDVLTVSALADFDGEPGGLGSATCRADEDDTLANFSNWGSTIEIAAPGVCILSTWPGGGYDTISGTSMASPHAAGGLAILASSSNPGTDSQVKNLYSALVSAGNTNWTDDSGDGVTERLLDVGTLTASTTGGGGGDPAPEPGISLSATGYKVKGVQHADLAWSGASATSVDVYRNGAKVETTANDGAYTDNIGAKGGGSHTYEVCEAGTSTCSNEVTVSF